jgi:hypothetical protein
MEILNSKDIYTPKNAKNQTKSHKMDVLEALEDESLESHSRGLGFESLCAHKTTSQEVVFLFQP